MARVTVEDCTDKVENKFELVVLASQRAKAITSGAPIIVEDHDEKHGVISLREIASGKLEIESLRDDVVKSLQTKNRIDEVDEDENLHAEAQEEIKEEEFNTAGADIFVGEAHSDLEAENLYSDNISFDEDDNKQ